MSNPCDDKKFKALHHAVLRAWDAAKTGDKVEALVQLREVQAGAVDLEIDFTPSDSPLVNLDSNPDIGGITAAGHGEGE